MVQTQIQEQELKGLIRFFFHNPIERVEIKFGKPIEISEKEWEENLPSYDDISGVYHEGKFLTEYIYGEDDTIAKVFIEYDVKGNGKIEVFEISMWREKLE